jgi:hypothetical protein
MNYACDQLDKLSVSAASSRVIRLQEYISTELRESTRG